MDEEEPRDDLMGGAGGDEEAGLTPRRTVRAVSGREKNRFLRAGNMKKKTAWETWKVFPKVTDAFEELLAMPRDVRMRVNENYNKRDEQTVPLIMESGIGTFTPQGISFTGTPGGPPVSCRRGLKLLQRINTSR
ncbi:hypothetical protein GWK47_014289 [Chionoecetes opilio]|uniref:Uncharacterized protein n=1 Tax=Chionoecetes opilio TaxID=41210 RepID=A0A8J4XUU1_CHIOP|nr:hypothetical protein GWK47_014289 [Chionoecetes opilio]